MEKIIKYIPLIFLIAILSMVFSLSLRYYQIFINNDMKQIIINSETSFLIPLSSNEKELINNFKSLEASENEVDSFISYEEYSPLIKKLSFFESVNKINKEVKFANDLLRKNNSDKEQKHYLKYILYPSITKDMDCLNFENARYKSQRFINNENLLNPLERDLTYSRKVLKLTKYNLYNLDKNLLNIINSINKRDDGFLSKAKKETMIKILKKNMNIDFIPYYLFDLKENDLNTSLEKFKYWNKFEKEYSKNIFIEEAIYNQILELLKSQEKLIQTDRIQYIKFRKKFYNKVSFFEKNFSTSYLLDDILYLEILYSISDDNYKHFKKAYQWFIENRLENPYFQLLTKRLFDVKGFDYTDFISSAIRMKSNMKFQIYIKNSALDKSYIKKLEEILFGYEGKNYNKLSIKKIIMSILRRGRKINDK